MSATVNVHLHGRQSVDAQLLPRGSMVLRVEDGEGTEVLLFGSPEILRRVAASAAIAIETAIPTTEAVG